MCENAIVSFDEKTMNSIKFFYFLLVWSTFSVIVHAVIEQVHLSLGTNETEMVITWTDPLRETKTATVNYGESYESMNGHVDGILQSFDDGIVKFYTFRALLTNLKPGTDYYYQIEAETQISGRSRFHTLPQGSTWLPRFWIYGDLGFKKGITLPDITQASRNDLFDVLFHVGNIAIDLHGSKGRTGNKFMRSIEAIASRLPYMTCPGNREHHDNFSHYDARFTMIGDRDNPAYDAPIDQRINNHFHSMDIGPAHIIMFSTEFYYYTEYGWEQIERQYQWLEEDLKRAQQNRQERPWIIVMGHRPLYCLNKVEDDESCNHKTLEREDLRQGIRLYGKGERKFGLEDLFYKYKVDLQFYGHEHFYARFLPIYNCTKMNGYQSDNPYNNARASIHVITGTAGDKLNQTKSINSNDWVAKYFFDHGYTRLIFKDKYRIRIQQVSVEKHDETMDSFDVMKDPITRPDPWVTKSTHTPSHVFTMNPDQEPTTWPTNGSDHNRVGMLEWIYNLFKSIHWSGWIYNHFKSIKLSEWLDILYPSWRDSRVIRFEPKPRRSYPVSSWPIVYYV